MTDQPQPAPYGSGQSPAARVAKRTVGDLLRAKSAGEPLVMITAYDYPSGRLVDEAGVDMILVGDSAAMVMLGHDSTNSVTMDEMLLFTRAVCRGVDRALVIGDMPFMSFQVSNEAAVANAGRFIAEAGADAVKLEGGGPIVDRLRAIAQAGIAVVGHLGLTPQSATLMGGFQAQARGHEQALGLVREALRIQEAGAIALVLEAIPSEVAEAVANQLAIPVIGIGAGAQVDGQVLVYHDLLGITRGRLPRFVRRYADVGTAISEGVSAYASEVRDRSFPTPEHTYSMPEEELAAFRQAIASTS